MLCVNVLAYKLRFIPEDFYMSVKLHEPSTKLCQNSKGHADRNQITTRAHKPPTTESAQSSEKLRGAQKARGDLGFIVGFLET